MCTALNKPCRSYNSGCTSPIRSGSERKAKDSQRMEQARPRLRRRIETVEGPEPILAAEEP